jgi:RNA-directed DNA polymerase
MAQKLDYPKSEGELRIIQDYLYAKTTQSLEKGELPRFKGLLEIISSESVILTAIHKIKANKGSETAGSDGETMRSDFLEKDYEKVVGRVKNSLLDYNPMPVRRVLIPKPGKTEKRPLGIPTIIDRIVQECIRTVIEPILEAQFFKHSYGFRPMRDAHMALNRVTDIVHKTGYHWVIEGDISKFFDNVNHSILIKQLWHMGIRDRRLLMIIKAMLKAGIMGEIQSNPLGTPQGGIISPLLANVYLNIFDQWIIREWEEKKLRKSYDKRQSFLGALHNTNLKPVYLIRYADDWVLITNSQENARKWKRRITNFLKGRLKLTLSEEKTVITNLRKKPIHFVGFEYKVIRGRSRHGYVPKTSPDRHRLKSKVKEIHKKIYEIRKHGFYRNDGREKAIHSINIINSQIRGVIEYYDVSTRVNKSLKPYALMLRIAAFKALKRCELGVEWKPACEVDNLISVHLNYESKIPSIPYNTVWVGVTDLAFAKWKKEKTRLKSPKETPYTKEGRELYRKRTGKVPLQARADFLLSNEHSFRISQGKYKAQQGEISKQKSNLYNFEYFLNRAYAYNRDKGRCRVCKGEIWLNDVEIHHIKPLLPSSLVNRVQNLGTVHSKCHKVIHDGKDYSFLDKKIWNKIKDFREKLSEKS